jgi:hypothetical protein
MCAPILSGRFFFDPRFCSLVSDLCVPCVASLPLAVSCQLSCSRRGRLLLLPPPHRSGLPVPRSRHTPRPARPQLVPQPGLLLPRMQLPQRRAPRPRLLALPLPRRPSNRRRADRRSPISHRPRRRQPPPSSLNFVGAQHCCALWSAAVRFLDSSGVHRTPETGARRRFPV